MKIFHNIKEWRDFRKQPLFLNQSLGFVPTMGNLHQGHLSLCNRAKQENNYAALTIFVNPTQFNNINDLNNYPRTLEHDLALAEQTGVDFVFIPNYAEIYHDNYRYQIHETELSKLLCGKHRPGHFNGVLTIVMKLFNLIKPQRAYFGEKDFQQLQLIKDMVEAFFLDIEIIPCPTLRDERGLALSSRNNLLSPEQKRLAPRFHELLASNENLSAITNSLEQLGFKIDYIEEQFGRRFGAVHLGDVRLIDNIEI